MRAQRETNFTHANSVGTISHAASLLRSDDASAARPNSARDWNLWTERARQYVDRGSRATELDPLTFVQLAGGSTLLGLLLVMTLFSWYSIEQSMTIIGTPISEREWYRGISYPEGKWVFVGALSAAVSLALGLMKKSWLPGGYLAAGAVGTTSAVVMLALRWRLATIFGNAQAQLNQLENFMAQNPIAREGGKALDATGSTLPTLHGGPSWFLALGILLAVGSAVAFLLLSLRHPQTIAYFGKPDRPPLVQKYGMVAASYTAAFLMGVVLAVIRH